MHLSSTFAISLVTGSRRDEFGYPSAFRIMLQLSHSADVSPSLVTYNKNSSSGSRKDDANYPNNLIFLSISDLDPARAGIIAITLSINIMFNPF